MACPGLLEYAPGSWVRQLILALNYQDRVSLFQTSKRVARQVTSSAPATSLILTEVRAPQSWLRQRITAWYHYLNSYYHQYVGRPLPHWHFAYPSPSAATDVEKAEVIISRLLDGATATEARLDLHKGHQPFPLSFRQRLTYLMMCGPCLGCPYHNRPLPACTWLQLTCLPNLKRLELSGEFGKDAVLSLCQALENGHMPCLQQIEDHRDSSKPLPMQHRFACALASTVKDLSVHANAYIDYLEHFKQLYKLSLRCPGISAKTMRVLCEHPTLHTVCMQAYSRAQSKLPIYDCKSWNTLVIDYDTTLQALPSYPLAALHVITMKWCICWPDSTDVAALPSVLEHAHKLVCEPRPSENGPHFFSFDMLKPRDAPLLQLVKYIDSTNLPVCVQLSTRQEASTAATPASTLVKALWLYLPEFVTHISMLDYNSGMLIGPEIWDNMPSHVVHVKLSFRGYDKLPLAVVHSLVSTVPAHVNDLVLNFRNTKHEDLNIDVAVASHIKAIAPAGLRLKLHVDLE